MPIADEHQSGVRRYGIFTFVIDDQGGLPGSPALRFPQSPHTSSLEVVTRLRHRESFFIKRLKSLEKGFIFPFVDISFFSSYQNIDEMKRLIEPTDCINFHDAAIHLQKGCYEEVQLVDPKRDMIQTPIDDDYDDRGSGSGSDANRKEAPRTEKVVHPPGIQAGTDDYKKTRGYIVIAYKTMEYMYSREFLSSWKTWTGVRYICMQIPRQLGLRRIAFYRQLSCTSDFSYVLLIEVTNLLLYAAQTLNLMDRIKLRLCGCAGIFRETDFQVDPVTANILHIPTNYRPPEKPLALTTALGRVDSVESGGSIGVVSQSRRCSQALTSTTAATNGDASGNVDTLMQLLKQQQEAAAKRKAAMEASLKREKRPSLAPPDYPAPLVPETATPISADVSTSKANGQQKKETSTKKAPTALPESEESEGCSTNSPSAEVVPKKASKLHKAEKRLVHQNQSSQQPGVVTHNHLQQHQPHSQQLQLQQQPMYHSTTPLYPVEISTAISTTLPHQSNPYFAQYHQAGTLPLQHHGPFSNVYGQILSDPIDSLLHDRQPVQEIITNDIHPLYTYTGKAIPSSPFGFVQPTLTPTPPDFFSYNSPVYTRTEWKKGSAAYGGRVAGEESIRNLAERFGSLKETAIIGSDPYLPISTNGVYDSPLNPSKLHNHSQHEQFEGGYPRKRSQSAATIEYPPITDHYGDATHDRNLTSTVGRDRSREHKMAKAEKLQQKIEEAERLRREMMKAEKLQHNLAEAEEIQKKLIEAERMQRMIAEKERMHHEQHVTVAAATERLHQQKETGRAASPQRHRERGEAKERTARDEKSAPKSKDAPNLAESPKGSPKRRILPQLPSNATSSANPAGAEAKSRRRHEKADLGNEKPAAPQQHAAPAVENGKTEKSQRHRRRSKDVAESNPQKEEQKVQEPVKTKREEAHASSGSKTRRASGDQRGQNAENGADTKTRSGARRNGSPPRLTETLASPSPETNNRKEKRSSVSKESRSRSRDNRTEKDSVKPAATHLIPDGPSTSATPVVVKVKTLSPTSSPSVAATSAKTQAISRSRSGSRRRRQASRRHK